MNTSVIVIIAAAFGLIVNTIAILAVAWRGGHILGKLQTVVEILGVEVTKLRDWRHDHDNLEQRVVYLEHELDEVRKGRAT